MSDRFLSNSASDILRNWRFFNELESQKFSRLLVSGLQHVCRHRRLRVSRTDRRTRYVPALIF
jgi:hypothetical protein